jgi:TPP-dependent pyruvate/acetoin dehydrogenase alpha subunit
MDLQTRKISFVQEFLSIQSEEVISRLEKYLKKEKISMEEKLIPKNAKALNQEIDRAIEDAKNGRVIDVYELKEKVKKWS